MDANRGPELIAICSTFVGLAFTAVALRIFVRLRLVKAFGWDDAFMVVALAFQIMFTYTAISGVHWGTGRHMATLDVEQTTQAMKYWYLCYASYCLGVSTAKISIGIFLLRVTVQPIYRRMIYTVMCATVVTGLIFFFISVLQCTPVNYFWGRFSGMAGTCVNINVIIGIAYAYSAVASVCDFTFGLLPIFLVWNLHMARSQKLMLIPILSMGCVASIAVTVRMGYLMKFKSNDFLYDTTDIAIWSDIEQGLGITAGSLATLRPLYRVISARLGWSDAGTNDKLGTSQRKGSHGWYRTPSSDNQKKGGAAFNMMSITRTTDETRRSNAGYEDLERNGEQIGPSKLREDSTDEKGSDKGFNSWRIQIGDRSDENLTVAQGITKQTDVFLESHDQRRL